MLKLLAMNTMQEVICTIKYIIIILTVGTVLVTLMAVDKLELNQVCKAQQTTTFNQCMLTLTK